MSNCSCHADPYQSFWQKLAVKYEKRIQQLTERRCEVRHRLEVLQLQLPTYLCYNLRKNPQNAEQQIKHFMGLLAAPHKDPGAVSKACACDPCPIKVPDNFPQNLYDFKYSRPIRKFPRTSKRKKKLDSDLRKSLICDCHTCVKQAEQRMQEGKPVIDVMIPEKLSPKDDLVNKVDTRLDSVIPENDSRKEETKKLNEVGVCAYCNNVTKTFKDAMVCECDICPEEVLRRINASDIKFEPVTCGCEELKKPKDSDVEMPICQCQSCKLELDRRLGNTPKNKDEEGCICYQHLGMKPDAICNCHLCADKIGPVESTCECKLQDTAILPVCACTECQKSKVTEEDIATAEKCICDCDVCTEIRAVPPTLDSDESTSHVSCICDCEECHQEEVKREKRKKKEKKGPKEICVCEAKNQSILKRIIGSETELRSYLKDLICDCNACAKEATRRLQEEGFVDTIPEKLRLDGSSKDKTDKKINHLHECTCCSHNTGTFKDAFVCECDLCAEAVLERINTSDLNFKALTCGCEELKKHERSDVEIPICQCLSCKLELDKRLGKASKDKSKDDCVCYNSLGKKLDTICSCDLCAEKLGSTPSTCDCKLGDAITYPICTCSECQEPQNAEDDFDSATRCICNCEICTQYAKTRADLESEESTSDVNCICNCEECNAWKKWKQENEFECACKASRRPCFSNYSQTHGSLQSLCSCEQELQPPISCKCSIETIEEISCTCSEAESVSKVSKPDSCICSVSSDEFTSTPALKTPSKDSCMCSVDSATLTPSSGANAFTASKTFSEDSCVCPTVSVKNSEEPKTSCVCFGKTQIVQNPHISPKVSNEGRNLSSCVCSAESVPETVDHSVERDSKSKCITNLEVTESRCCCVETVESKGPDADKSSERNGFTEAFETDRAVREEADQIEIPRKPSDVEVTQTITDYYDVKRATQEQVDVENQVHGTESLCSCDLDAKREDDSLYKNCATESDSCCCLRAVEEFSKILVERYILTAMPKKDSETESEGGEESSGF
ncbi:hypothetical protein Trydic_g16523 [Trypoxylus dichotomus]